MRKITRCGEYKQPFKPQASAGSPGWVGKALDEK